MFLFRKVDRRALATDIDAELGFTTCVWDRIGQMARGPYPSGVTHGSILIPVSGVSEAVGDEKRGNGSKERSTKT